MTEAAVGNWRARRLRVGLQVSVMGESEEEAGWVYEGEMKKASGDVLTPWRWGLGIFSEPFRGELWEREAFLEGRGLPVV